MVSIHLDGLGKRYGDTTALADVHLDVADGEFFTLVGPSGCGKTTTLRTVAGFEAPSEGTVRFGDRDVAGVPPEDRDVGVVFQSYALFPHMTVAENVGYGLRFADPPDGRRVEERVADLLDLVDLAGFEDRDPESLSGGQQQRVALARALAPGPDVLLLDEPMSALDARLRERLRRQVRAIQSELEITTIYVTHDQEEALAVSDRLAVMHDGRVEQVGTPREVYRRPATRFVAGFVGENNLFDAEVLATTGEGRRRVAVDGAEWVVPGPGDDGTAAATAGGAGDSVADGATTVGATDEVTVCVRPETLTTGGGENDLTVDVTEWSFLGESVRVHADWGGREVVVRLPDVPEDDELHLGFDPEDAHVLEG
jgi:thiamine transport system ATP-binding protein